MSTPPVNTGPNWAGIWADLLRSTGRTLLRLDGSPLAAGVLTGLDEFEEAQDRRRASAKDAQRRRQEAEPALPAFDQTADGRTPGRYSSNQYYERRSPDVRDGMPRDRRPPGVGQPDMPFLEDSLPSRPMPMPTSPVAGWWLTPRLPFTPDGALNLPRFRR